ncbi:NAD(P)/FAD-dependent oxidoreductase [Gordonia sp. NPDC003425]
MRAVPPATTAVIGSGVAGLTAAHILSKSSRVTLFEADDRLGGHAHTHQVPMPDGSTVGVDSGFIVHNTRTYPTLLRLFDELGVATRDTDMSMSVHSELNGLEYAGALGISGLFPTARNLRRGRYLLMLGEIVRFHRAARRLLDDPDSDEPLAEFVVREGFSDYFQQNFMLPLVAAVWSCDAQTAARYPARYLFTFLDHHGMLTVFGSPTWRTVVGGSGTYVRAVDERVRAQGGTVRTGAPVTRVHTRPDGSVEVGVDGGGSEVFDAAVIATHPHQALRMLAEPTADQQRVLSAISYLPKPVVLHSDTSLMPQARRAWASWNYQIGDDDSAIAVTYDLTRLMRLDPGHPRMLVTVGRTDLVDESSVIAEMTYEHPVYTTESVAAQAQLPQIDSDSVVFAGAYHGWGFHEDGAASGARAAARLGADWNSAAGAQPPASNPADHASTAPATESS